MATPHEFATQHAGMTVSEIYHNALSRLLESNVDLVMHGSTNPQRTVEVLHLVDPKPQHRLKIEYHVAYRSLNTEGLPNMYGLYIANPWRRSRRTPKSESRHYFDGPKGLIVREDTRLYHHEFDFVKGKPIDPLEAPDPEYEHALLSLYSDLDRAILSTPLRPMRLVFDKFAIIN